MVSIVIPLYNGEKFIEKTLRDVTSGSERDIEIIVVDDGSTDSGADKVHRMAAADPRIKYLKKDNGGIASARNYGLERAAGEYVCFIDQDDYVYPDMFTVLREDLENTGADFVRARACEREESADRHDVTSLDRDSGTSQAETTTSVSTSEISNEMPVVTDQVEPSAEAAETVTLLSLPDPGERSCTLVTRGTTEYERYLQGLVMRGCAPYPKYETAVSIWCCMFGTDFLRKNNVAFHSFCDYEDDWVASIRAFAAADKVCFESRTVYCWRVHAASESHNRVAHDRYIEDFYEKYCAMRTFLLDAIKGTYLDKNARMAFERELQKRAILWNLSNETGRGIEGRRRGESTATVKEVVAAEREHGLNPGMVTHPISTTGYGVSGAKKFYHKLREAFLTFLLLHHMEGAAVYLNSSLLHGRWHI